MAAQAGEEISHDHFFENIQKTSTFFSQFLQEPFLSRAKKNCTTFVVLWDRSLVTRIFKRSSKIMANYQSIYHVRFLIVVRLIPTYLCGSSNGTQAHITPILLYRASLSLRWTEDDLILQYLHRSLLSVA